VKGGQRHIGDVLKLGPDIIAQIQLLNWTSQVFGIIGVGAGKVSVSALLLAIMKDTQRSWQKIYIWTFCIVLVCGVSISCSILTMSQCRPAAALWDQRITGKCIKPTIMADYGTFTGGMYLPGTIDSLFIKSAYNTFVDASLAILPTTIFWSLNMGSQEKTILCIVFALNVL
jgi:hypothetical protein